MQSSVQRASFSQRTNQHKKLSRFFRLVPYGTVFFLSPPKPAGHFHPRGDSKVCPAVFIRPPHAPRPAFPRTPFLGWSGGRAKRGQKHHSPNPTLFIAPEPPQITVVCFSGFIQILGASPPNPRNTKKNTKPQKHRFRKTNLSIVVLYSFSCD